jgi:hypothetical protein
MAKVTGSNPVSPTKMIKYLKKKEHPSVFLKGFLGGLGWTVGATLGFAIFVAVVSMILNLLGGLPVVGNFLANIIHFTSEALKTKVTVTR